MPGKYKSWEHAARVIEDILVTGDPLRVVWERHGQGKAQVSLTLKKAREEARAGRLQVFRDYLEDSREIISKANQEILKRLDTPETLSIMELVTIQQNAFKQKQLLEGKSTENVWVLSLTQLYEDAKEIIDITDIQNG